MATYNKQRAESDGDGSFFRAVTDRQVGRQLWLNPSSTAHAFLVKHYLEILRSHFRQ